MKTKPYLFITLLLAFLCVLGNLSAVELRRDFAALRTSFEAGQLDNAADQLLRLRPSTDEERAFVLHYTALLKAGLADAKPVFNQNIERYPSTYYGQMSMLELGKILLLEHDLQGCHSILRRITHPDIVDRLYWQAVCSMQLDQHEDCISFADSFIRLSGTNALIEKAFYLMADSQMTLRRYQNAVSTLNRLKDKPGLPSDEQYFYYQLASAYEKAGNITEAVANYRRSYESNKFTQVAYQIEDKLFALRSTNRSQVDISFLYPYTELNIPVPSDSIGTANPQNTVSLPVVTGGTTLEPRRVNVRPNSGYYLQAGRFSVEANALSRANEICTKNLQSLYFPEQQGGRNTWVVMSGPFSSAAEAETARNLLISHNIDCFAVRY